jgi:uncharacterized low-complexity protein
MSKLNPLAAAIGAAVVSSGLSLSALAANPFQATDLSSGYQLADAGKTAEGKCGEGKCGEGMCGSDKDHSHDPAGTYGPGKSAEGKCGEGKCGEGMCGSVMQDGNAAPQGHDSKTAEGMCGEGVCGGNMKKHEDAAQAKP